MSKPQGQRKSQIQRVCEFELRYEKIRVQVQIQTQKQIDGKKTKIKENKQILKQCSGIFQPGTFTAIIGPSGSGKTTMLNLLSSRLIDTNINMFGDIFVNGKQIYQLNDYRSYIGYVLQDDYMYPTFTPQQSFRFVANLRLSHKTQQQREIIVMKMINILGLDKCKDTYIGDTFIRGLSGGEKRRTSIGLQLLTNPSIIFLDEPTTGLDSTTSLNLIALLKELANKNRTVISTIHQPSSEIFMNFDRILLMIDGHIIYHGSSTDSLQYFKKIGFSVPYHANPADHFLKLMNKQGIMLQHFEKNQQYTQQQINKQFNKRVEYFIQQYFKYKTGQIKDNISPKQLVTTDDSNLQSGWCIQFAYIAKRSWINQFRQPGDFIVGLVNILFFAFMAIILFNRQAQTITSSDQNLQGACFTLVVSISFSTIFINLNVFNLQRPIFLRQRLSQLYATSSFFLARSLVKLPIQIINIIIFTSLVYFAIPLQHEVNSFFLTMLTLILVSWMSGSYGLFLSTLFKDSSVATALVPLLIIPFLLVAGFFIPLSKVHDFYRIFEVISFFKYGFQATVQIQYLNGGFPFKGSRQNDFNAKFQFDQPLWLSLLLLFLIGFAVRIFSLLAMYFISNPKPQTIRPTNKEKQTKQKQKNNIHSKNKKQLQNGIQNKKKVSNK